MSTNNIQITGNINGFPTHPWANLWKRNSDAYNGLQAVLDGSHLVTAGTDERQARLKLVAEWFNGLRKTVDGSVGMVTKLQAKVYDVPEDILSLFSQGVNRTRDNLPTFMIAALTEQLITGAARFLVRPSLDNLEILEGQFDYRVVDPAMESRGYLEYYDPISTFVYDDMRGSESVPVGFKILKVRDVQDERNEMLWNKQDYVEYWDVINPYKEYNRKFLATYGDDKAWALRMRIWNFDVNGFGSSSQQQPDVTALVKNYEGEYVRYLNVVDLTKDRPPLNDLTDQLYKLHDVMASYYDDLTYTSAGQSVVLTDMKPEEAVKAIGTIGPKKLMVLPKGDDYKLVEPSRGFEWYANAIGRIEGRLPVLGAQFIAPEKFVGETASAMSIRNRGHNSALAKEVMKFSSGLESALRIFQDFHSSDRNMLDTVIELSTDFEINDLTAQELGTLWTLKQAGAISYDSFYTQALENGLVTTKTAEDELQKIVEEDQDNQQITMNSEPIEVPDAELEVSDSDTSATDETS